MPDTEVEEAPALDHSNGWTADPRSGRGYGPQGLISASSRRAGYYHKLKTRVQGFACTGGTVSR